MKEIDDLLRDAEALVNSLTGAQANWRPKPGVWSVTESLDHLTLTTRSMMKAMDQAVEKPGAARGNDPFRPTLFSRFLLWMIDAPARVAKVKAPPEYQPPPDRPKHVSLGEFIAVHRDFVRRVENEWAGFDLNRVEVTSPFDAKLKYSLGTGIAIIPAHGRRHLWIARRLSPPK